MSNKFEKPNDSNCVNGSALHLAADQRTDRTHDQLLTPGAIIAGEGQRFDGQGESMARRRYQKGRVVLRGKANPVWVGRWREDVIGADGVTRRVERSEILGSKEEIPTQRLALRRLKFCLPELTRRIIGQAASRLWPSLPKGGKKRCSRSTSRVARRLRSRICGVTSCRSLGMCALMRSERKRSRCS